jgi:hypothetical protein
MKPFVYNKAVDINRMPVSKSITGRQNLVINISDYHSRSAWNDSGIPSLSMFEFIDQKIKKMNAR